MDETSPELRDLIVSVSKVFVLVVTRLQFHHNIPVSEFEHFTLEWEGVTVISPTRFFWFE